MSSTSDSPGSAITKGKRSGADTAHDKPVNTEEQAPAPKRQHTASQSIELPTRAEVAQIKHQNFMNLPPEVFILIAAHVFPSDIIALARTAKFLRNLLMSRSSISIWHQSMKNVEGIPPCPKDISEPQYMAFIYMKECSLCGSSAVDVVDSSMLMRLCQPCDNSHMIRCDPELSHLTCLLPNCERLSRQQIELEKYILRQDFLRISAEHEQLLKSNNKDALETWVDLKKANVAERDQQAPMLWAFLVELESQLIAQRVSQIRSQLAEIGWSQEEITLHEAYIQWTWCEFATQGKRLTNENWAKVLPEMVAVIHKGCKGRREADI